MSTDLLHQITDGVHLNLPEALYFGAPAIGSTDLKKLYWDAPTWWAQSRHNRDRKAPARQQPRAGTTLGSGLHALTLEGDGAYSRGVVSRWGAQLMIEASPLTWPEGWPRTRDHQRKSAKFGKRTYNDSYSWKSKKSLTIADGVARVTEELERLGVRHGDMIISTNLQLRLDGLPRSGQGEPRDPGVAVYWVTRGNPQRVMAVDTYDRVADNLAAIAATLGAMRSIERHGGAQILDRAFTGFTALPAPSAARRWWEVLGVSQSATRDEIQSAHRKLAIENHPDRGGDPDRMADINAARDQAMGAT